MEDNKISESLENENLKNITKVVKGVAGNFEKDEEIENCEEGLPGTAFKVASTNLPAKPGFWTKVKNILFYEIKVELTPYQQKIEDEINEFLHQEITWKSLKEAALSEVPITFRGKRVF